MPYMSTFSRLRPTTPLHSQPFYPTIDLIYVDQSHGCRSALRLPNKHKIISSKYINQDQSLPVTKNKNNKNWNAWERAMNWNANLCVCHVSHHIEADQPIRQRKNWADQDQTSSKRMKQTNTRVSKSTHPPQTFQFHNIIIHHHHISHIGNPGSR